MWSTDGVVHSTTMYVPNQCPSFEVLNLKLSLVIRCSLFLKGADVVSYLTITTVSHNVRFASFSVENVLAVDSRPT